METTPLRRLATLLVLLLLIPAGARAQSIEVGPKQCKMQMRTFEAIPPAYRAFKSQTLLSCGTAVNLVNAGVTVYFFSKRLFRENGDGWIVVKSRYWPGIGYWDKVSQPRVLTLLGFYDKNTKLNHTWKACISITVFWRDGSTPSVGLNCKVIRRKFKMNV